MKYADSACKYTEGYEGGRHYYIFTGSCIVTGEDHSVLVWGSDLYAYRQGKLIQDAMPRVKPEDREFLVSGVSPKGWKLRFGEDDEA